MSGAITGPADAGWLSSLISDAAGVRQKLDTLSNQASTGLVGTTYAGLGSGAAVSLNLNPEIANLQTWQANINQATGPMQVTQTAMTQLQSIAQNFYAQINTVDSSSAGLNTSNVDVLAASARSALQEVAGLLDTTDGNTYVFGGADSTNPPVPGPDLILGSGFYTQINSAVGNLASNGAVATAAATLATASSNAAGTSPFSVYMSQSAATLQADTPAVQVGQGRTVQIGLLASANGAVSSTGSSTTGSYMRDLMRALATIGSLSSTQAGASGYQALVQDTSNSLQGVISAMAGDAGVLGNTQTALTATQTQLSDTTTALTTQVSGVQDVDMALTLSNLTLVQTQMQASYQVIAGMSGLSLAKFLPS
jgi:flagellar hook-associated protein 3 FlgL